MAVNGEEVARAVVEAMDGRWLATAESCTAGRVASALASVEGAKDFLRGGLVAYGEEVKRELLGVTAASVYSTRAATEMAEGACRLLGADAAVATTGVVGGDPVDGVPAGTVFIATCIDGATRSIAHHFSGTPEAVCDAAARQALHDLLTAVRLNHRIAG